MTFNRNTRNSWESSSEGRDCCYEPSLGTRRQRKISCRLGTVSYFTSLFSSVCNLVQLEPSSVMGS